MNVPKLRFKEFNDEWIETKIQNVATVIGGGTPSTDEPKYWGNEINWFTPSEIGKTKYVTISNRKISQDGLKNSSAKLLPKGTILLSSRATVGEASILLNEASTNQGFQSLIVNENNCNEFIYYLKYKYKKEMLIKSFGSTFLEISKSNVENIKIKIPSKEEQFMIANFLSLLDKKIELQSKKIEDLKLFKLSKYSSIFSKSNNKIKLSDICIIEKGKQINSDLLIEKGNYYMLNGGILPSGYLNEYNTNENTITISEGGNSCGYVNFNKTKFWCGGHCYKIISSSVNSSYLYHLLKYNEKIIMDLRVGSGLPNIQKKDLEALKLSIHKNDEQLKIGILFDTFDKKINLETNKLNKFKELKKALMQVMFV